MSNLKKNIALSTLCKPVSMIVSYLYVPIVLNYLGIEKYGIWATILSILSWITYFDIGIGNGLRNKLTESIGKKDGNGEKLVSSAYAFITIITIAIAIVFSVAGLFINWNAVFGVEKIEENLYSIIIISCLFVLFNFILSLCKNVLYALQKAANVSIMELIVQVLNLLGVIIARHYFPGNLFIMTFVYGLSMTIVNVVTSIIIYSRNASIRPKLKYIDIGVGKNITNLGFQFFVIQICALILFTTDSLIISSIFGAVEVTPYNTVNKLFHAIIGIFAAMTAPIWSAVTKIKTENNLQGVHKLEKKLTLLFIVFSIGAICLKVFFRPISKIWLGRELFYDNSLIEFGMFYCVISMWTNMQGSIANGLGVIKQQIPMVIIQAIVNIPLSIFLAVRCQMGSAGVLLGTDISLIISSVWLPIIIYQSIRKGCIYENSDYH